MTLKHKTAIASSLLSGAITLLNSWSFFQQSTFYYSAACYTLAFGSLTLIASIILALSKMHELYFGTLIAASSISSFLIIASLKSDYLFIPSLIAFYLGIAGGLTLATIKHDKK